MNKREIFCTPAFQNYVGNPIAFLFLLFLVTACGSKQQNNNSVTDDIAISPLSGKELSILHCSRCHAYVAPGLLAKSNWKDVLPAMGHRMGIYSDGKRPDSLFDPGLSGAIVREANIYPEKAIIAKTDWQKIEHYFLENAPDSILAPVRKTKIHFGLKHFKYREAKFSNRPALTTLVKILPEKRGIVFADGKSRRNILSFLTPDLQERFSIPLNATPVQYYEKSKEVFLTTTGNGIFPTDAAEGTLQHWVKNDSQAGYKMQGIAIPDLQRPVSMAYGDINKDGWEDVVACEFGNETGKLVLYENNTKGGYTKRILRNKPGAITAVIKDANNDGLMDIYVLMAQGDEAVFLYENQGSGKFREKKLLSFLPLNGSQYIELADVNKDGFEDIIYACGDNADKTPILKDYHGIYIFLNDGKLNFKQAYFYPLNGAYKAMVRDFDLDGDLDIAAISFFPDYLNYPEESFIYLENKGNLKFTDYSFPEAANGRWVVMDAGDMDADGDMDLVLGSFVYFLPAGDTTNLGNKWLTKGPSVIVLENTIR